MEYVIDTRVMVCPVCKGTLIKKRNVLWKVCLNCQTVFKFVSMGANDREIIYEALPKQ